MADVVLQVNGRNYTGWESLRVSRSMRAISGAFSLTVSEPYQGTGGRVGIYPGDACALLLNGRPVITGFVDGRAASFDAGFHSIRITGRDKTGDMVDGAADVGAYEFAGLSALQIAQRLAKPFGVTVGSSLAFEKITRFAIQPGESAFETLARVCKTAGVFPVPSAGGSLELVNEGTSRAADALIEGENIKAASLEVNHQGRFNRYVITAQHVGIAELSGEAAAGITAQAVDDEIRAARVKHIRAESGLTEQQARDQVAWEAAHRVAGSVKASVTVAGWTQGNGELWELNTRVNLASPTLRARGEFVITDLSFALGDTGTESQITLAPVGTLTPAPVVAPVELPEW